VSGLERRLGIEDAVVGDDAHLHAVDLREAGHDGGGVLGLELVEATAVSDTGDNLNKNIDKQMDG
jgi:hypothetical protein